MKMTDILIVGGSAAGVTAAMTARKFHPNAEITLVRKEEKVLIPCGIPYIFGTIGTPEKNLIPDAGLEKNKVNKVIDEVVSIDKGAKTIATSGGETIGYERMILTTGSLPFIPRLPGPCLPHPERCGLSPRSSGYLEEGERCGHNRRRFHRSGVRR